MCEGEKEVKDQGKDYRGLREKRSENDNRGLRERE